MNYWCLYKAKLGFKWGELYAQAKPHLAKRFTSEEEGQVYLATLPQHLRVHMAVTQGCSL